MKNIQLARIISLKLQLVRQGVGVYIGDSGVYIAEVVRTMSGIVLNRMAYEPFPTEMEESSPQKQLLFISETVAKCSKQAGVKPASVFSSPSPAKVVTRYFQTPVISKKEWKEAIRFEGSRFVPYRLDETVFGFYAKELREKKILEVVFSAIRINTLREHVRAAEGGGLKLWDTETPFHAMVRGLRDKIHKKEDPILVLHFSRGSVALCLAKGDIFYVSRDFFISSEDPKYLEKFFAELNSSIDYFKRQTGDEKLPRILIAGDWDLIGWKQQVETYFHDGTQVEIATFPTKIPADLEKSSAYLIPAGLALRSLGVGTSAHDISLLASGAVAEERIAPRKWTGIVILSILLAGVLFYFGFFIPRSIHLKKALANANARVSALSVQTPELASQSVSVLERRLTDIETKTKIVQAFQTSRSLIGEKLSVLSQTIPAPIWFSSLSYEESMAGGQLAVDKHKLTIQAYIYFREIPEEELRRINEYVDSLRQSKEFMAGFNELKLEGVERMSTAGRNFTRFRIICT